MATYKSFEELPVWSAATDLAVAVFRLTEAPSFRYKGDLVNQLRRAALSVPNNVAEGFERGTTAELVTFLYIARGSAGEVRSMLRFALRLGEMPGETARMEELIGRCESVSRQLRGWLDSLQNSDIAGQRHLNDRTRRLYEDDRRQAGLDERFAAYRAAMAEQLASGVFGTPDAPPLPSLFPPPSEDSAVSSPEPRSVQSPTAQSVPSLAPRAAPSPAPRSASSAPPVCPQCGRPMVRRTSRDGSAFWGCSAYPNCKGSRRV